MDQSHPLNQELDAAPIVVDDPIFGDMDRCAIAANREPVAELNDEIDRLLAQGVTSSHELARLVLLRRGESGALDDLLVSKRELVDWVCDGVSRRSAQPRLPPV